MKTKLKYSIMLMSLFLGVTFQQLHAQVFNLNSSNSTLTVEGTSNVHDWDIKSDKQTGKLQLKITAEGIDEISVLEFELHPENLKSGKSGMDRNTYKALKTDKHKKISFSLKKTNSIKSLGNNKYSVSVNGDLLIAGVKKPVDIQFEMTVAGNRITLLGNKKIKMTSFNIDPPKALMGTITTGDEVTVKFNSTFTK